MKQYIVLIATVALGAFIFRLIMGPGEDSVLSMLERVFGAEIERRMGAA
ncbi:MAG: hypothetical protein LBO81_00870 [Clostridiales Family XIII bacterium]|jgi:hypothetical protein|nr:hypothetical protein [Clostridiales Family XIII bacterium]